MRAEVWRWLRVAGGTALLMLLFLRLGTRPFVHAATVLGPITLAAALAATALTTICCAWRWQLIANTLGAPVRLPVAVTAYYRSQFLNATLPGGVLGDVHRAVRQGRDAGDVGRAVRSVAWERVVGQLVQLALLLAVLLLLPTTLRLPVLLVSAAVAMAGLLVLLARRCGLPRFGLHLVPLQDLRRVFGRPLVAVGVLASSTIAALTHAGLFLLAARAVGVDEPAWRLLPLALLVLVLSAVPTNIAGWGPREGAAAWVFGSAGLTAAQGLTVSVLYGVMVLVATLPGALILLLTRRSRLVGGSHG